MALQQHVGTTRHYPPTDFYLAVTALIPEPTTISAAVTTASMDGPTVWTSYIATDRAFVHVIASFDADLFDLESAEEEYNRRNPPEVKLLEAWTRPLSSITRISFASVGRRATARAEFVPVGASTVTFADGGSVEIPGHANNYDETAREQLDALHTALNRALIA
ncbi:hypothetical protein [Gordonia terrae]|uniref:hypothetical protein n=1 Tax=Gordonia terrae TaxID=2055 RepID=UPI003F6BABE6